MILSDWRKFTNIIEHVTDLAKYRGDCEMPNPSHSRLHTIRLKYIHARMSDTRLAWQRTALVFQTCLWFSNFYRARFKVESNQISNRTHFDTIVENISTETCFEALNTRAIDLAKLSQREWKNEEMTPLCGPEIGDFNRRNSWNR